MKAVSKTYVRMYTHKMIMLYMFQNTIAVYNSCLFQACSKHVLLDTPNTTKHLYSLGIYVQQILHIIRYH